MRYTLRSATLDDRRELRTLIAASARGLGAGDYTRRQIDGALQGAFGVDTQLIEDGTYFAVECDGCTVGCGGWSWRATLFGGDNHDDRSADALDPRTQPGKIRAFFVDPGHARRGIGTMILERCERDARERGFRELEMMATLPGKRLYERHGYIAGAPIDHELAPGLTIEFVPMRKTLDDPATTPPPDRR